MKKILLLTLLLGVVGALNAQMTVTPQQGCSPLNVNISVNVTATAIDVISLETFDPSTQRQSIILDTFPFAGNYSELFITSGVGQVRLTQIDTLNLANPIVTNIPVTTFSNPSVSVTLPSPARACIGGAPIVLTGNAGASTVVNWNWSLPGAVSSNVNTTVGSISSTYNIVGTWPVTLRITDNNGCSATRIVTAAITVNPRPVASFTASNTTSCSVPHTANFTPNPSSGVNYFWDFNNTGTYIASANQNTYNACGNFGVGLAVENITTGCRDTVRQTNVVTLQRLQANPTASSTSICEGNAVTFTANATACAGFGSTITYLWSFGNGVTSTLANPSVTFATTGTFTPTLTIAAATPFACSTVSVLPTITVNSVPVASFSADRTEACASGGPAPINFSNLSTPGSAVASWYFNYTGNGSTFGTADATGNAPSFSYTNCAPYNVAMIVTQGACRDTLVRNAYINIDQISASFNAPSVTCAGNTVTFANGSISCQPIATYNWFQGTTSIGTTSSVDRVFNSRGSFTISLNVTSTSGCTATFARAISVNAQPVVTFTASPSLTCGTGITTTFTDNTTGTIVTRQWNLDAGNGNTFVNGVGNTITRSYTTGLYDVTLRVTDQNGCSSFNTRIAAVRVGRTGGNITANNISGCSPVSVTFRANPALLPGDVITAYIWDFGDGSATRTTAGNINTQLYSYTGTNCYRPFVALRSNFGCVDTLRLPTSITPPVRNGQICVSDVRPTASIISPTFPLSVCFRDTLDICREVFPGQLVDTTFWAISRAANFVNNPAYTDSTCIRHPFVVDTFCYDIRLIVGYHGCLDTATYICAVDVVNLRARFTQTIDCNLPDYVVSFNNQTNAGGIVADRFEWDFGVTGITTDVSTLENPTYTYTATGTYRVKLKVYDDDLGCVDSVIVSVRVNKPNATFTVTNSAGCAPFALRPTGTANVNTTYAWASSFATSVIGANTRTPSFIYAVPGIYNETLTLTVTDNISSCTYVNSQTYRVTVYDVTASMNSTPFSCGNTTMTFTNTSSGVFGATPSSLSWAFPSGVTANTGVTTQVFPNNGSYVVTLTVRDNIRGCADTARTTFRIGNPRASFTLSSPSLCFGSNVSITNTSTNATSYQWTSAVGTLSSASGFSPTIAYPAAGSFLETVVLTVIDDSTNCTSRATVTQTHNVSRVVASFTPVSSFGCSPLSVTFIDQSTNTLGTITNWAWRLPTAYNDVTAISHTEVYTPGIFTPSLTVTNSNGCTASFVGGVTSTAPSLTWAVPAPAVICPNTPFTIDPSWVNATGVGALSYSWDFGDGTASVTTNIPTATHTYASSASGARQICLTIADGGCTASLCSNVTVSGVSASFVATSPVTAGCPPLNVNFNASASLGNVTQYLWNFGGFAALTSVPTTSNRWDVATDDNNDDVGLTVTDQYGCTSSMNRQNYIFVDGPIARSFDFTPTIAGCGPMAITFTFVTERTTVATLNTRNGNPIQFTGLNPTGATTTYVATYTSAGSFRPILQLPNGCSGFTPTYVATNSVLVETLESSPIVASQTISCNPMTVTYAAKAISSAPLTVTWTTNGGTVLSQQTSTVNDSVRMVVAYNTPGIYGVSLSLNNGLCSASYQRNNIVVAGVPTAAFTTTYPDVCNSQNIQFTNSSTVPFGNIANVSWDFGDGTALGTQTASQFIYSYPSSTTTVVPYTVNLTITNNYGCTATATQNLNVYPLVIPTRSANTTICLGESTNLTAGGALTYLWNPSGSLSCNNCNNPTATPTATTRYTIEYGNTNGCIRFETIEITVNSVQPVITPNSSLCIGESIQLNAAGGTTYNWGPATDLSATNIPNPISTPTATIGYVVTVGDALGCTNTASVIITVNANPTIANNNAFFYVCPGDVFPIGVTVTGIVNPIYQWDTAVPGLSDYNAANPTATPSQDLTRYGVTVSSPFGCSATGRVSIIVYNYTPTAAATVNDNAICKGETVTLGIANPSRVFQVEWSPASAVSNSAAFSPTASPIVDQTYRVTITYPDFTTFGYRCSVTDQVTVAVTNFDQVTVSPGVNLCLGSSTMLTVTDPIGSPTALWDPAATLDNPTSFTPIATPTSTTTYVVTLTKNGCFHTESVTVDMYYNTTATFPANRPICIGDFTQLVVTPTVPAGNFPVTYNWDPTSTLNNSTIANPIAVPTVTTVYQVTAQTSTCAPAYGSVEVVVNSLPVLTLNPERLGFYLGESIGFNNTVTRTPGTFTTQWTPTTGVSDPTALSPSVTPFLTTTYLVSVTDANGCTTQESVTLTQNTECDAYVIMPNAFTPDGDGQNERFFVRRALAIREFVVFDRWGQQVFFTRNINDGWDGNFNGEPAPSGVYIYYVTATCPIDGSEIIKRGNVTLIR